MTTKTAHEEQIKKVQELVRRVYQTATVGGCAHIVLDDYNVHDHDIEWCLGFACGFEYGQKNPEEKRGIISDQELCLHELKKLPYRLREKTIREAWG